MQSFERIAHVETLLSANELAREVTPFVESRLLIEDAPRVVFCEECQSEQPAESVQSLESRLAEVIGSARLPR